MNTMSLSQASTLLNAVVQQATGQASLTAITTPGDLVAVAQKALLTGADPILNALSQVWSRSIFAYRNYNAPNAALRMELDRWGNAIRKISPVSGLMLDDDRFIWPVAYDSSHVGNELGNGQSVDHYKIQKQEAQQLNFYGTAVYEQLYTIFKDNFDSAFSNADEFARFNAMNVQERANDRETYLEQVGRVLQANYVGALLDENDGYRVIHALTEYNNLSGASLTNQTVFDPANFAGFIRWLYSRIVTTARMFGERSNLYQTIVDSKAVLRHTKPEDMRIALFAPFMDMINAQVLSTTYHDTYLDMATWEGVNYWQSIKTPDSLSITPVYTDTTGALATASAVSESWIIGIIHDRDALGYAVTNEWAAVTPLNIIGGYWNEAHHMNIKTMMDMTEKGAVILLD